MANIGTRCQRLHPPAPGADNVRPSRAGPPDASDRCRGR